MKQLFLAEGIGTPRGEVAGTAETAAEIAGRLGGEVVIKAQINATSRAALGGIRFASSPAEARDCAAQMLGKELAGNLCKAVLVEEKVAVGREFYLGFIVDTALKRPVLLFSAAGGSGIEERAGSLNKLVCAIRREPSIDEITAICGDAALAGILQKLYRVAKRTDARTAEINPLAQLREGRLVALDGRLSVDDYAAFRQPALGIGIARELGHTPTKLEQIAWHIEKEDYRGTFFFVEILDGPDSASALRVGFHGAGGGGAMAALDAAQRHGLAPACYVDTSGNPPASKVYRAARLILSLPGLRGYFLAGSGVASQEQFVLARAVLKAFLELRPRIPAVLRLGGNGEEAARALVERYAARLPAPVEAYQKEHPVDFCAARLTELVRAAQLRDARRVTAEGFTTSYSFKTRTGTISFDYARLDEAAAQQIVASCPQQILRANEAGRPVLAIAPEEAERGKCSECLACEFASLDLGLDAVRVAFPIEGLDSSSGNGDTD